MKKWVLWRLKIWSEQLGWLFWRKLCVRSDMRICGHGGSLVSWWYDLTARLGHLFYRLNDRCWEELKAEGLDVGDIVTAMGHRLGELKGDLRDGACYTAHEGGAALAAGFVRDWDECIASAGQAGTGMTEFLGMLDRMAVRQREHTSLFRQMGMIEAGCDCGAPGLVSAVTGCFTDWVKREICPRKPDVFALTDEDGAVAPDGDVAGCCETGRCASTDVKEATKADNDEWRPMKTAPRKEADILVAHLGGTVSVMSYLGDGWYRRGEKMDYQDEHLLGWLPLPKITVRPDVEWDGLIP